MCGFAVVIGDEACTARVHEPSCRNQLELILKRRGPDGIALFEEPGIFMMAARLVHWEEGAATQPYRGPQGRLGVFNGELFNLSKLQARLGKRGASEIEVLVEGLHRYGPAFLRMIDGQFAAVVRLCSTGPFYAVRDRFGVCPLYIANLPDGMAAASNIASLHALSASPWAYSLGGLRNIMTRWAPSGGSTPYDGIIQVAPGEIVTLERSGVATRATWLPNEQTSEGTCTVSPESPKPDVPMSPSEVADTLEEALRASIDSRLRSATTVACLISGGIDSTVIGAIAAQLGCRLGVGLVLEGDRAVSDQQQRVAEAVGLELRQHVLTPTECLSTFRDYVLTRKIPLVRLGPVGMAWLARSSRADGVRAVLSGEGADELFAGYDAYRVIAARGGLFGNLASLDWDAFGPPEFEAARGNRWARSYWQTLVTMSHEDPTGRAGLLRPLAPLLSPWLRSAVSHPTWDTPDIGDGERSLQARGAHTTTAAVQSQNALKALDARRKTDLDDLLGSYLLTVQGDHAWMEEGVELRPPYLSDDVARVAFRSSPAQYLSIGAGKRPVRAVLESLASQNVSLADFDVPKSAFRVDARFLLGSTSTADHFVKMIASCPDTYVDVEAVTARARRCAAAKTCSEGESMLFTFAASLGLLT